MDRLHHGRRPTTTRNLLGLTTEGKCQSFTTGSSDGGAPDRWPGLVTVGRGLGPYIGAVAQSNVDEGPDLAPPPGDLETAYRDGQRIAEITLRLRGVSSSNLVADGNEMSLAREIPSLIDGTSP